MNWPVRVQHSLNMIAELPEWIGDETYPPVIRAAALDSLYLHLYLMAGFLVARAVLPQDMVNRLDKLASFVSANVLSPLHASVAAEPYVIVDEAQMRADVRLVVVAAEIGAQEGA